MAETGFDLQGAALFMAHVWETIRSSGYDSIIEHGDPDGIDYVAKAIIREAAEQSMHQTGLTPRQKEEVEQIVMRALSTGSV